MGGWNEVLVNGGSGAGEKEAAVGGEKAEEGRTRWRRPLLGRGCSLGGRDPIWTVLAQERQDLICISEEYP